MSKTVRIGDRKVGPGEPVFVIAEIGCNFSTFEEAAPMIEAAVEAGADAVKIQTFEPETVATANAVFDMENTGRVSQREIFSRYSIDDATHARIYDFAAERGVLLFTTPTHVRDLDRLEQWEQPAYKIGSDDSWNIPFLQETARRGRPVILSTGMATMTEVEESVEAVLGTGNRELILLQCLSDYPASSDDVNLKVMDTFRERFPDVPIGYSDHTIGPLISWAAVARGACVIEKHFTLDKKADGPDHALSADPSELDELVRGIRQIERALGDGIKAPTVGEKRNIPNNRKSVVTIAPIAAGELITPEMIDVKRPGDGIPPKFLDEIVGRRVADGVAAEVSLKWDMLE